MNRSAASALVLLLVLVVGSATPALAQDAAASDALEDASSPSLEWRVLGGIWAPRVGGTVELGSSLGLPTAPIDYETEASLDDSEMTPFVELEVGVSQSWSARVSGFDFDVDGDGSFDGRFARFGNVPIAFGDPFEAKLEMTSAALDFRFESLFTPGGGETGRIHFMPTVSGRWVSVEQMFAANGRRSTVSSDFFAVEGGFEFEIAWTPEDGLALGRAIFIDAGAGIGPAFTSGDIGFAWHVRASITWEPIDHIGLTFGYRLLELDVDDGDFSFEAGLQGLVAGVAIRF